MFSHVWLQSPAHLLGAAYVIDAICRRSQAKQGISKDKYGPRFAVKIKETIQNLNKCIEPDKPAMERLLRLWKENNVISMSGVEINTKRPRIPSPHTPPGNPPPENKGPIGAPPPMTGGPPPMMGGPPPMMGGPPPMLGAPPPMMGGDAAAVNKSVEMAPIALDLNFDYDDDVPITGEDAITDAKRRRLEQERRVNESMSNTNSNANNNNNNNNNGADAGLDIIASVQGLIHNPDALQTVLDQAGLTVDDLVALIGAQNPELVAQLRAFNMSRQFIQQQQFQSMTFPMQTHNQQVPPPQAPVSRHYPHQPSQHQQSYRPYQQQHHGGGGGGRDHPPGEVVELNGQQYQVKWSTTVYVGNLSAGLSEQEVRGLFDKFGKIVNLVFRPDQGKKALFTIAISYFSLFSLSRNCFCHLSYERGSRRSSCRNVELSVL